MTNERQFSLKIEGSAVLGSTISFKLLASLLNGIQQTFHYIALAETKRDLRKVGRIPTDIMQACELRRVIEMPGSYELIAEVADNSQARLFADVDLGMVTFQKYMGLARCVSSKQDGEDIYELFPDSVHRRRILRSMESYCPKEGDEWSLSLSKWGEHETPVKLTRDVRKQINNYINYPDVDIRTVTGELVRIHLDERRLSIRHIANGRILDCFYDPELEDFIIANLKDVIQVSGRVQLDNKDEVEKIIDVKEIAELDLSPVHFSFINNDSINLILLEPLILQPIFDGQEVLLELPEFNIIAEGATRNDAVKSFEDDLVWLWKEYALASDEELSGDARELKGRLLKMVKQA